MSELDHLLRWARPWLKALLILVCMLIFLFAVRQLGPPVKWALGVVSPFLVALIVAYIFHPVVTYVQRKLKLGRLPGILIVALGLLLVVGGLLGWLLPVLFIQSKAMLSNVRESMGFVIERTLDLAVPDDGIEISTAVDEGGSPVPGSYEIRFSAADEYAVYTADDDQPIVSGENYEAGDPIKFGGGIVLKVEGDIGEDDKVAVDVAPDDTGAIQIRAEITGGDLRAQLRQQAESLLDRLDTSVQEVFGQMSEAVQPVAAGGASALRNFAEGLWGFVLSVGGFIAAMTFVLIIAFYYLAEMDKIPQVIRVLLPNEHRDKVWDIALKADKSVGGFLRGQLTVCLCVGVCAAAGLYVIGLKQYAILIGVLAGLFNFVPYLGPVMGAAPAVLWALFSQNHETWGERGIYVAAVVGLFAFIQMLDGFVFQPYIVGGQASLHPLTVMLALFVGAQAGLGGMIVAVPVACIVKVAWVELFWTKRERGMREFEAAKPHGPPPPDVGVAP